MLVYYFTSLTARPSSTRLRVIREINRTHDILRWKIFYKDLVVSPSY